MPCRPTPPLLAGLLLAACGCDARPVGQQEVDEDGCRRIRLTIASPSMGREIRTIVVLPPAYARDPERRFPVLYALHGRGAPWTTWADMPTLRQALADRPMIVVVFDADLQSWYLDADLPQTTHLRDADRPAHGPVPAARSRFTTWFFDELIPAIDADYRTDPDRRMLTGFSMGGFGAFHYLLTRPHAFVSASALSGAFMPTDAIDPQTGQPRLEPLLGSLPGAAARYRAVDILPRLGDFLATGGRLPPCHLRCGSSDPVPGLLEANRALDRLLAAHGRPGCYHEEPGAHDWAYWKGAAAAIIDFHWRTLP